MARVAQRDVDYLKRSRQRVETARKFRQHEGLDDLWRRLIDLYRGKHFSKALSYEDKVAINLAFSTINVIGPSVSINNPKVVINARQEDDEDRAEMLEHIVNYWWRHFDLHDEFRRAVDDFLILGFGWLKTGYRFVEETTQNEAKFQAELAMRQSEAQAFADANPDLADSLPTPEELANDIDAEETVTVEDRPFVERISPFDVFVDPEATSMRDARWIAQRILKDLDEVRDDDRYDGPARRAAQPDGRMADDWRPNNTAKDTAFQRVTVWEFYDLRKGTMCVFAEAGEGFLVKPVAQPYKFGHPFTMMRNYDVPDVFYPMGELEAIETLQQELNLTRTAQLNDRKQMGRAWLIDENSFDAKGIAQLKSSQDNRVIPVIGNKGLDEAMKPLPVQQLNPQLYENSDLIEKDINTITGVNEYARGELPEIRRTATEANIIQDASNARAADKLAKVEKVIAHVARRLVMLAQQYLTEPQVARIESANGASVFFEFQPDDIIGEFDYDVEGGSTQPLNEQGRRQSAVQMFQTLEPLSMGAPGAAPIVNPVELVKHLLKDGFGIKDPARFIQQQPPPVDPSTLPMEGGPVGPPDQGGPPPPTAQPQAPQPPAPAFAAA